MYNMFSNKYDRALHLSARRFVFRHGGLDNCVNKYGKLEDVDVNVIYPGQPFMSEKRLAEQKELLAKGELNGYPIGIKFKDVVFLLDGHHRVAAQILDGVNPIKIMVVNTSDALAEDKAQRR